MSIKDRITEFAKKKGYSISAFERECGLGNATISKIKNNIRKETLEKITKRFSDADEVYLVFGYSKDRTVNDPDPNIEKEKTPIELELSKCKIKMLERENDRLWSHVNSLLDKINGSGNHENS